MIDDTACNLRRMELPIKDIAQATGLTEEEIGQLEVSLLNE